MADHIIEILAHVEINAVGDVSGPASGDVAQNSEIRLGEGLAIRLGLEELSHPDYPYGFYEHRFHWHTPTIHGTQATDLYSAVLKVTLEALNGTDRLTYYINDEQVHQETGGPWSGDPACIWMYVENADSYDVETRNVHAEIVYDGCRYPYPWNQSDEQDDWQDGSDFSWRAGEIYIGNSGGAVITQMQEAYWPRSGWTPSPPGQDASGAGLLTGGPMF